VRRRGKKENAKEKNWDRPLRGSAGRDCGESGFYEKNFNSEYPPRPMEDWDVEEGDVKIGINKTLGVASRGGSSLFLAGVRGGEKAAESRGRKRRGSKCGRDEAVRRNRDGKFAKVIIFGVS